MRFNELTLPPWGSQKNPSRTRITEKVPQPAGPGLHVELDIKAIKVQGQRKNALTLNFVDLFHRQWFPYYLGWSIRKEHVMQMVESIFGRKNNLEDEPRLLLRADNGSQFIADDLAELLFNLGIDIEYIHPATPEENAHVESFHSIMERALVRQNEFESLDHLAGLMKRFHWFYNYERLHKTTCYRPPMVFLDLWKKGFVTEKFDKNNRRKFILSKEGSLNPPFSEQNVFSL